MWESTQTRTMLSFDSERFFVENFPKCFKVFRQDKHRSDSTSQNQSSFQVTNLGEMSQQEILNMFLLVTNSTIYQL